MANGLEYQIRSVWLTEFWIRIKYAIFNWMNGIYTIRIAIHSINHIQCSMRQRQRTSMLYFNPSQ